MNGRMAKQLRRVSRMPSLPEETIYNAIQHKIVQYGLETSPKGETSIVPHGVIRIQVVMGKCIRSHCKTWKARYNHFIRRSNTLPHRGLNKRLGG